MQKEELLVKKEHIKLSAITAGDYIILTNNNFEIKFNREEFRKFLTNYFETFRNKVIKPDDYFTFSLGSIKVVISSSDMEAFNFVMCKACRKLFGSKRSFLNSAEAGKANDMLCIKNLNTLKYFQCFGESCACFTNDKSESALYKSMSDENLISNLKTLRNQGYKVVPIAPEKNLKKYVLN